MSPRAATAWADREAPTSRLSLAHQAAGEGVRAGTRIGVQYEPHPACPGGRTQAAAQAENIKKLTLEKERYASEGAEAADRYAQATDAVKEREIAVLQLQKKIAEACQ